MRPQNFGLKSENLGRNMTFSKKVCLPENIPPDTQNPMQFWKPCRIISVKGLKSFHLCPKMTKEVWFFLQKLISVRKLFWTVRMQFWQPCPKFFLKPEFFRRCPKMVKKKYQTLKNRNVFDSSECFSGQVESSLDIFWEKFRQKAKTIRSKSEETEKL